MKHMAHLYHLPAEHRLCAVCAIYSGCKYANLCLKLPKIANLAIGGANDTYRSTSRAGGI